MISLVSTMLSWVVEPMCRVMKVKAIIRCNKYGFKSCFGLGGVVLKTLDYSKPAAWQTLCFCDQTLIYQKAQLLAISSTVIQKICPV